MWIMGRALGESQVPARYARTVLRETHDDVPTARDPDLGRPGQPLPVAGELGCFLGVAGLEAWLRGSSSLGSSFAEVRGKLTECRFEAASFVLIGLNAAFQSLERLVLSGQPA